MSRDPRDRREPDERHAVERPGDPGASPPGEPERATALLTAYVDGVAELPVDERHAVERWLADDPGARADADAVHGLLGRLRALPPDSDGGEPPDWAAMERSIRHAVAAEPPRPWWRTWRWLVPAMTCAAAVTVMIALWPRTPPVPVAPPVREPPPAHKPPPGDDVLALWLDGSELDVDLSRPGAIGEVLGAADGTGARADEPGDAGDEIGLLPAAGMAWIDGLDEVALERAERALAAPLADPAAPAPAGSKG